MATLNEVRIIGNLTRDVELRSTPNGHTVANFGVATDRGFGNNKKTVFIDVTVWNKQAENAEKFLQKGSQVLVCGELDMDAWEDRDSGKRRTKIYVTARNLQYLSRTRGSENNAEWNPDMPQAGGNDDIWSDQPEMPSGDDLPF